MKSLAFPFERAGFRYELIERQGLVCLVKQTRIGHGHWCYELVKLRVYPDKFAFGKLIPAHEAYPGDEDWGSYGFTYRAVELERARHRMASMANALGTEPKTGTFDR